MEFAALFIGKAVPAPVTKAFPCPYENAPVAGNPVDTVSGVTVPKP